MTTFSGVSKKWTTFESWLHLCTSEDLFLFYPHLLPPGSQHAVVPSNPEFFDT
jgi:hypothetical protein